MEFKTLLWSRFDHKSRKFAYVIFLLICIIKSYDLPSVKLWDELKVKLYGMYKYRKYDTSIWWHEICWKMHLWKFIRTNTFHISNLLLKIDNPHKNLKVMTSKIGPELRQKNTVYESGRLWTRTNQKYFVWTLPKLTFCSFSGAKTSFSFNLFAEWIPLFL